jgi:hypothetical protein
MLYILLALAIALWIYIIVGIGFVVVEDEKQTKDFDKRADIENSKEVAVLLPCPFCANTPCIEFKRKPIPSWQIVCGYCDMKGKIAYLYGTNPKQTVVDKWNTRL